MVPGVVIDTNIFVAAGFKPDSASGRLIRAIREGRVRMPWSDATRAEIRAVLTRIPPLSWTEVEDLFRADERVGGDPDESGLDWVADPSDLKFAAVARVTGAILVSNDDHLLARRAEATFTVLRPGEYGQGT